MEHYYKQPEKKDATINLSIDNTSIINISKYNLFPLFINQIKKKNRKNNKINK